MDLVSIQQSAQELIWGQPIRITKRFTFEAAHRLPNHNGKCSRLHGHSYVLEVELMGYPKLDDETDSEYGMVIDFSTLSAVVKTDIIELLDHRFIVADCQVNLNDYDHPDAFAVDVEVCTAERLVQWITAQLWRRQSEWGGLLTRVRLYETETGWAEWQR
jgi:6-pyruvoyltetrahydropterin/6-carboxytetrahydropterin synthase